MELFHSLGGQLHNSSILDSDCFAVELTLAAVNRNNCNITAETVFILLQLPQIGSDWPPIRGMI